MTAPPHDLSTAVRRALEEDFGPSGDVTTAAVVPANVLGSGTLLARHALVVCGQPVAQEVFRQVDATLGFEVLLEDGAAVEGTDVPIARVHGSLASILRAERVALNFMQRLSGVATWTRAHVDALEGAPVRLVGTRKTTPGLRQLEKYAVAVGGASNHRSGLYDGIMVKDNHILAAGGVGEAVQRARANAHHLLRILVEVEDLDEARAAAKAGAEVLLLDNFDLERLAEAVTALKQEHPRVLLEASGGISLETLARVAATGVDLISSGALVHQARWVDLSLEVVRT